jgi:hypothetical protein
MVYQPNIRQFEKVGKRSHSLVKMLITRFITWASHKGGVESVNPSLRMMIDQQDLVNQEIFELSLLADASSNSIVKYGECQEALCKKKAELVNIEKRITGSLFTALNKNAANYSRLEEWKEEDDE